MNPYYANIRINELEKEKTLAKTPEEKRKLDIDIITFKAQIDGSQRLWKFKSTFINQLGAMK